jgi:hypothetical protein
MTIENQQRFERAIALFDAANAQDPNQDEGQPKELLYAKRMTEMIGRYAPEASEVARLAVRAQHIKRWTVPRGSQPMTKEGYYAWRTGLYQFHAATAGALTAPKISMQPGLSSDVIILSFAIVVIGGLGSVEGAAIGAVLVGLARAASVHLMPQAELFMIYLIMAGVLMFRPEGLFKRETARRI